MPDAPRPSRELAAIDRARASDHDALVELYRQDAPPAWRLALALTADPDLAAEAVADGFARVLAPPRDGEARSAVPFPVRLLTATRLAVIDADTSSPGADVHLAPAGEADELGAPVRTTRAAEVLRAFHQLPERWRSILWLVAVEGLATPVAAGIVGVRPDDGDELAARAGAGLRTQWIRDRVEAGEPDPVAPDHLESHLQTVLPLPLELFGLVERRWRDRHGRRRPTVTGLVLPGGRPLPRWAERSLIAGTAALIVLGITSALAVGRDPDVRRARGEDLAGGTTRTTLSHAESSNLDDGPMTTLDEDDDAAGDAAPPTGAAGGAAVSRARAGAAGSTAVGTASSGMATPAGPDTADPTTTTTGPTPTTTAPPLLQVNVGVGPALAVGLGDCTGVELAGQVLGCPPDPDTGLHVDGTLLGR